MTHSTSTPYDSVLDTIGWTPLIRLGRDRARASARPSTARRSTPTPADR